MEVIKVNTSNNIIIKGNKTDKICDRGQNGSSSDIFYPDAKVQSAAVEKRKGNEVVSIRGRNPEHFIEKIIRTRILESLYWKEECFALTAELMVDKAINIQFIGGVYGGNVKVTPFLCLLLKMLQLQPEKDIVVEFITQTEYKCVRALGAMYMRITGTSLDCYKYLEPLYCDYSTMKKQQRDGSFKIIHMDEFVDELLREERVLDVILPRILKREDLEQTNQLEPRTMLDVDMSLSDDDESRKKDTDNKKTSTIKTKDKHKCRRPSSSRDKTSRSRSPVKRMSPTCRSRSREREKRGEVKMEKDKKGSRRRERNKKKERRHNERHKN